MLVSQHGRPAGSACSQPATVLTDLEQPSGNYEQRLGASALATTGAGFGVHVLGCPASWMAASRSARKGGPAPHLRRRLVGRNGMPKMVVTHAVVDVDNWLKGKAERADAITSMGCTNVVDYVAEDGTKAIAITADANDPAAVMAAISSPPAEVAAAMERHGVLPPVTIYI